MGARSSLGRSIGLLKNTPSLLAVGAIYALIVTPLSVGSNLGSPILSIVASLAMLALGAFVFPFFLGGGIGLASNGLRGGGDFGTFLDEGKDNYLYMLGFTWIIGVVEFAWSLVVGFFFYFVAIFLVVAVVLGVAASDPSAGTLAQVAGGIIGITVGIVFVLLFYLVAGIPMFLVQFVPGAYVVENRDPIDGLKRGLTLLKNNLLSAIGFDVSVFFVNIGFSLLSFLPLVVAGFVLGPDAVANIPSFSADAAAGAGAAGAGPGTTQGATETFSLTPLGAVIYGLPFLVVIPFHTAFIVAWYTSLYHDIAGDVATHTGSDATPDTDWDRADDATA